MALDPEVRAAIDACNQADGFDLDLVKENGTPSIKGTGAHFWLARETLPAIALVLEPGYDTDTSRCHSFPVVDLSVGSGMLFASDGQGRILAMEPPAPARDMAAWKDYVQGNPDAIAAADARLRDALQGLQRQADAEA